MADTPRQILQAAIDRWPEIETEEPINGADCVEWLGEFIEEAKEALKRPAPEEGLWLIWSREHRQWWKPGESGYTKLKSKAGRYTFAKAFLLVMSANAYSKPDQDPNEAMIPEDSNG